VALLASATVVLLQPWVAHPYANFTNFGCHGSTEADDPSGYLLRPLQDLFRLEPETAPIFHGFVGL
jgi:hypothetical protein